MSEQQLMKILLAPYLSEKATIAEQNRVYVFRVLPSANKINIKKAVELMFKVTVEAVRTVNVRGKQKMFRHRPGRRKDWKKAYVTLKEGEKINLVGQ